MLSKGFHGILKEVIEWNFLLTDWLPACIAWCLRLTMTGLIFSLFNIDSAQEVSFGIPQYVQCIHHELTSVLLCVPFIFVNGESVGLVAHDGFLSQQKSSVELLWLQRNFSNSCWLVLLCNMLNSGYLTFQVITGQFNMVCVSSSQNNNFQNLSKKLCN